MNPTLMFSRVASGTNPAFPRFSLLQNLLQFHREIRSVQETVTRLSK